MNAKKFENQENASELKTAEGISAKEFKNKPLVERKAILRQALADKQYVKQVEELDNTLENFNKLEARGEEGVILKQRTASYSSGSRSSNFLKVKFWKYKRLSFNRFEEHNKGIKLYGDLELNVNGFGEATRIKEAIARDGKVELVVRYSQALSSGKLREPSYRPEYACEAEALKC